MAEIISYDNLMRLRKRAFKGANGLTVYTFFAMSISGSVQFGFAATAIWSKRVWERDGQYGAFLVASALFLIPAMLAALADMIQNWRNEDKSRDVLDGGRAADVSTQEAMLGLGEEEARAWANFLFYFYYAYSAVAYSGSVYLVFNLLPIVEEHVVADAIALSTSLLFGAVVAYGDARGCHQAMLDRLLPASTDQGDAESGDSTSEEEDDCWDWLHEKGEFVASLIAETGWGMNLVLTIIECCNPAADSVWLTKIPYLQVNAAAFTLGLMLFGLTSAYGSSIAHGIKSRQAKQTSQPDHAEIKKISFLSLRYSRFAFVMFGDMESHVGEYGGGSQSLVIAHFFDHSDKKLWLLAAKLAVIGASIPAAITDLITCSNYIKSYMVRMGGKPDEAVKVCCAPAVAAAA